MSFGVTVTSGVGIELCSNLLRGVTLDPGGNGVRHAAEVALTAHGNDQMLLDAMIRLRADLGADMLPARLATFPSGSWMRRIDVTGRTGPELNALRTDIDRRFRAASTLLVDDGPRRWFQVIHWPDAGIRRIEIIAERAGFVEVAVEPSPVALGRSLDRSISIATRYANVDEAFATGLSHGIPVAAVSLDATGHLHPDLQLSQSDFSPELFDELVRGDAVAEQIDILRTRSTACDPDSDDGHLRIDGDLIAHFPPHDLRSTARQCVAIGAAIGATGLAGRIRPVDIITDAPAQTPLHRRPWVVEQIPTVEPAASAGPNAARRTFAKVLPRRRR